MSDCAEYSIHIADVTAAHGVRGELKVSCDSDMPGRMQMLQTVCIRPSSGSPFLTKVVRARQVPHKSIYIVQFQDVTDRDSADKLLKAEIYIQEQDLQELPDDTYYVHDILGLEAVTVDGEKLGHIVDILETGANDVYVTENGHLIPATSEVVIDISLDDQQMLIKPLPGMFD